MPVTGSEQLRAVSRDLRVAGTAGRGLRAELRRNLVAAMAPTVTQVKRNAFTIPTKPKSRSTGLRTALMRATRARINTGGKYVRVGVIVDGSRMPAGQQSLPQLMEGERVWRHPVFGDTEDWVTQEAHPFVAPAIPPTIGRATVAVDAAISNTALQLSRGIKK